MSGWCVPCGDDVQAAPGTRFCAACGHILIPPSWSSKDAALPWPERPDGWAWSPPKEPEAKIAQPRALAASRKPAPKRDGASVAPPRRPTISAAAPTSCAFCGGDMPASSPMGKVRLYCSRSHRDRAKRERDAAERARMFRPQPCVTCHGTIRGASYGGRRRFCSEPCRRVYWNAPERRGEQREAVAS